MIRAKKSLGQHFLKDRDIAYQIANAIAPETKSVVEVGPGLGMLTQFLIQRFETLLLIEKDTVFARQMRDTYATNPAISVAEADVLTYDFAAFWGTRSFSLIGNFPYNISSQIVFRVLDLKDQIPEMIGMFQYEMARRIIAGPGTKDYGIMSVLIATAYRGELLFRVPPAAFDPPPKVESAVIRLRHKTDVSLPCTMHTLRVVVKTVFSQRRKMLRNTLKPLLPDHVLQDDPMFVRRPEQLSLEEFIALALLVEQHKS